MPSFRRSRGRRFKRGKRQFIWETVTFVGGAVPSTGAVVPLVNGADWHNTLTLAKGAVCERIVGYWLIQSPSALSEESGFDTNFIRMMISKNTQEGLTVFTATPLDLSLASSYDNEDVLYTDGWGFGRSQGTGPTQMSISNAWPAKHFDIRTKRKLTSDDVILIHLDGEFAVGAVQMLGVFRALISLP